MTDSPPPTGRYRFTWTERPAGPWVRVDGPGVPSPVELRIVRAADGRHVVTGLLLGVAEPVEITTATLRRIRLAEIVGRLFEDFEDRGVADWALPWASGPTAQDTARGATRSDPPAEVGSRGPDDATLRAFARVYLSELARRPTRAMTTAAERHKISRSAAHRWARMCRERGYLPPKGKR